MFGNKGYVGQSMSKRAVSAYNEGLLTKNQIKKDDLKDIGIDLPVGFVKSLMPHIIKPSEWHHTGKYYNETDFYDLEIIKEQLENLNIERMLESYKEQQKAEKEKKELQKNEKGYYGIARIGEWEGTRKHPKLIESEEYVYIKGDWAYKTTGERKKVSGKHFQILKKYKIKPRQISKGEQKIMLNNAGVKK